MERVSTKWGIPKKRTTNQCEFCFEINNLIIIMFWNHKPFFFLDNTKQEVGNFLPQFGIPPPYIMPIPLEFMNFENQPPLSFYPPPQTLEQNYAQFPPVQNQQESHREESPHFSPNTTQIILTKRQLLDFPEPNIKVGWTEQEDKQLCYFIQTALYSWKKTAKAMGRTYKMCYSRYRRLKEGVKNCWTKTEEQKVKALVDQFGYKWKQISERMEGRTSKQIRERYINFIKEESHGKRWTVQQDLELIDLVNKEGKKWANIAKKMSNRSQNQIKNRFFNRILKIWNQKNQQQ